MVPWRPSHHTDGPGPVLAKNTEFQDRAFRNGVCELIPSSRHHRIGTSRNLPESLPGFSQDRWCFLYLVLPGLSDPTVGPCQGLINLPGKDLSSELSPNQRKAISSSFVRENGSQLISVFLENLFT